MLEIQDMSQSPMMKKKSSKPVSGLLKNISKEIKFAKKEAD